ncbi:hypothetical protein COMA2_130141 [Candidatus Nitrospira nitrificans]|uniref:Uncharacterized protein n=1 Tax=Candidatus Nitrospira nitrificans TaxID=1742973 RepID=A0A0S4L7A8_9BACT|nr:hypothetical protein COMA2_130141 [Candidatus Nitrospira nitrificans]
MLATESISLTKDQLMDLERTVAALDNRLQSIQRGLGRSTPGSLVERFRSLLRPKQRNQFMSTVCNRHVRLNTKLTNHDSPRA